MRRGFERARSHVRRGGESDPVADAREPDSMPGGPSARPFLVPRTSPPGRAPRGGDADPGGHDSRAAFSGCGAVGAAILAPRSHRWDSSRPRSPRGGGTPVLYATIRVLDSAADGPSAMASWCPAVPPPRLGAL